ncbi:MAG: hypothetical protein ACYDAO_05160 [Thermoplasmataceae archaeon]
MIQEEKDLLRLFNQLESFRVTQGQSITIPIDIIMGVVDKIKEVRRKMCYSNVSDDISNYCTNLQKTEDSVKKLKIELDNIMERLNLDSILVEEVPDIISSWVSDTLDEPATEAIVFNLKVKSDQIEGMK